MILQKVEEAYQILQNALDPGAGRFDKLELGGDRDKPEL